MPFRAGPLFVVAFLAVLTHPFLDWLTTYAIAIFAPLSWRWYSGNAIFIVDWVYWLLMIAGIGWSARALAARQRRTPAGRRRSPALLMLGYIAFNLGESVRLEQAATDAMLRARGIEPTLVVASPPPFAFWERDIAVAQRGPLRQRRPSILRTASVIDADSRAARPRRSAACRGRTDAIRTSAPSSSGRGCRSWSTSDGRAYPDRPALLRLVPIGGHPGVDPDAGSQRSAFLIPLDNR